jgi:hypothetical protein
MEASDRGEEGAKAAPPQQTDTEQCSLNGDLMSTGSTARRDMWMAAWKEAATTVPDTVPDKMQRRYRTA